MNLPLCFGLLLFGNVASYEQAGREVQIDDMIMTYEDYLHYFEGQTLSKEKRAVLKNEWDRRWTGGIISYDFDILMDLKRRAKVDRAMKEFEDHTCLQFKRNYPGPAKLNITSRLDGCAAYVGMMTDMKPQEVYLGDICLKDHSTVVHELAHAIGLRHEHQRSDRDDYIFVNYSNIISDGESQFWKMTPQIELKIGVPYDYWSVMHYSSHQGAKDRRYPVIVPKNISIDKIGKGKHLSFRDVKTINLVYNCSAQPGCNRTHDECPGEGFINKHCQCVCPKEGLGYFPVPCDAICPSHLRDKRLSTNGTHSNVLEKSLSFNAAVKDCNSRRQKLANGNSWFEYMLDTCNPTRSVFQMWTQKIDAFTCRKLVFTLNNGTYSKMEVSADCDNATDGYVCEDELVCPSSKKRVNKMGPANTNGAFDLIVERMDYYSVEDFCHSRKQKLAKDQEVTALSSLLSNCRTGVITHLWIQRDQNQAGCQKMVLTYNSGHYNKTLVNAPCSDFADGFICEGCKTIQCLNGGTFDPQTCACQCKGGYTGRDCGQAVKS